jgi:hypothetical protein
MLSVAEGAQPVCANAGVSDAIAPQSKQARAIISIIFVYAASSATQC